VYNSYRAIAVGTNLNKYRPNYHSTYFEHKYCKVNRRSFLYFCFKLQTFNNTWFQKLCTWKCLQLKKKGSQQSNNGNKCSSSNSRQQQDKSPVPDAIIDEGKVEK